jgi:putative nucleotidyltransferase with HDIG domain
MFNEKSRRTQHAEAKTKPFVQLVCILACVASVLVWQTSPVGEDFSLATIGTLALLALLALLAELMIFLLPQGATGSISFIPYIAAFVLVPNVAALVAIGATNSLADIAKRRGSQKVLFNSAQLVISYALAITLYRLLGGVSLLAIKSQTVSEITAHIGLPLTAAYVVVFVVNMFLVSHVVALATNKPTLQVWRINSASTVGLDILALPLVFVFAVVYAKWGAMVASFLWVPILGVRQMNTTNLELAQTNRELLELMVKSIEARDPYTSGHSRRVREYAIKIAKLVGIAPADVEKIGTAALLHDVGKIYDKYAPILAKEERLTPEEWAIIKEHPVDGANLIATMTKLRELVPAVRHHHENWDGTGYPSGLKDVDIPLASRIIIFADTFDAMTTERPYRGPLGEEVVRAEILRCRGRQFDPEIADRLLASDFWTWLFPPADRVQPHASQLRLVSGVGRR